MTDKKNSSPDILNELDESKRVIQSLRNQLSVLETQNKNEGKLFQKYQLHSDMLHYLAWLEKNLRKDSKSDYVVVASDGTKCYGHNYLDAVRVAMEHDKSLQDQKEKTWNK